MTPCSHTFCKNCILGCLRKTKGPKGDTSCFCPQCRLPILSKRDLKRNLALEKVIEMVRELKSKMGM
jgi:hypothetical protein